MTGSQNHKLASIAFSIPWSAFNGYFWTATRVGHWHFFERSIKKCNHDKFSELKNRNPPFDQAKPELIGRDSKFFHPFPIGLVPMQFWTKKLRSNLLFFSENGPQFSVEWQSRPDFCFCSTGLNFWVTMF